MLAKVPALTPDAVPAPPSFTATFNPSPNPPTSNQFFLTADGASVANLVLVDAPTEISITLAGEGASFSSRPIVWSLPPEGGELTPPTVVGNTLTFTVPAPKHVLFPWVFRFIVDFQDVIGVRSQNIYLAKTASGNREFILKYAPDNGNFSLVDSLDSAQDGVILGDQLVLVNTQVSTFALSLQSDPPSTLPPVFATDAIAWSSGSQPDWIPSVSGGGSAALTIQISPPAALGQSIGLQFAIVLNGLTILSPDPILINATIGDG